MGAFREQHLCIPYVLSWETSPEFLTWDVVLLMLPSNNAEILFSPSFFTITVVNSSTTF